MKKYRVLITDGLSPVGIDLLKTHPEVHLDIHSGLSSTEIQKLIPAYQALIVGESTVDSKTIDAAKDLGLIVHTRSGVGAIDLEAARVRNIAVRNTRGAEALSVAEYTMSQLLTLARPSDQPGVELHGKVFGIFGLGSIGKVVAEKAMAMGMQVIAYDPLISSISMLPNKFKMLETRFTLSREPYEVFLHADFLGIFVSENIKTQPLIGAAEIEKMKDGVFLLNLSHASAVDEGAAKIACASKKISAYTSDPKRLGGNTVEARERGATIAAEHVLHFFNSGMKREVLN